MFSFETTTLINGVDGHLLTFSTGGFAIPVIILSFPLDDLVDVLGLVAEMGRERFASASPAPSPSATSSWTSMSATTTTVLVVVLEVILDDSNFISQSYEFLLLF